MSVRVDAKQAIAGISKLSTSLPQIGEASQRQAAQSGVDGARRRVHVITGRLRNSIRIFSSAGQPFTIRFGSDIHYAGQEEFRPGHSYLMAEYNRMQTYWPELFLANLRRAT
jgi:hypothetical protein